MFFFFPAARSKPLYVERLFNSHQQRPCFVLFFFPQLRSDLQSLEPLVQTEETSAASSSSPPPISPACSLDSPVSPTSLTEADSTETSSVKPRRRSGRSRPRPISDYAQLVSRKHLIPEEAAEQYDEERTSDTLLHHVCGDNRNGVRSENCGMNGDVQRHRPISVIGAVDLFPSDSQLEEDCLPSVSFACFNVPCLLF